MRTDLSKWNCGGHLSYGKWGRVTESRHSHLWRVDGDSGYTACGKKFTPPIGESACAWGVGSPSCPKCSEVQ